ncbi:MAG: RNA methyltransferase [Bacteroidales bacterium]|nr:RNA methyltransferase [Bacteroidales bacterium]
MSKIISSLQNPVIKNVLLLSEKPRAREEQNRIVIEGLREIRLAIVSGFNITDLFFSPELVSMAEVQSLLHQSQQTELTEVSRDVYNRMAYRKDSGGLIALAEPRRLGFSDLQLSKQPLLLVLETVEKPGNLGALLRTADAANLDAVIICDPQTDIYNPNAIRSGIGCVFTMPVVTASSEDAIAWMRGSGIKMFGAALTATRYYHKSNFVRPAAIVMGSEANGLSNTWLESVDDLIKIPMMGKIDSMNVSVSAAIVIFEALRQRDFR